LLLGWAVGMATGTAMFVAVNTPNNPLVIAGFTLPGYAAIYSVILNIVVVVVLTPIFNALRGSKPDATVAADHRA
jgi:SSS family solute:Na+ symporter